MITVSKKDFEILREWKIKWVCSEKYQGQVTINPKKPKAVIYKFCKKPPIDFVLHELLHCAIRAILRLDKRKIKELINVEERLITDICYLFTQCFKS